MGSARDVETRKMRKFSMKFRGNMGESDMPELRSQIMPVSEEIFTQMRLADEVSKRSLVSLNIVCSTRAARSESSNSKSSSNLSEDQSTCGLSEVQDDMNTPQPTYRPGNTARFLRLKRYYSVPNIAGSSFLLQDPDPTSNNYMSVRHETIM